MSSQEKVMKAVKGNKDAFYELIHAESRKLYNIAYLYVKNENDAVDIVQETIYKAYRSIKWLKETNHFSTWLTRILINTALDFVRKNRRVVPFEDMEGYCGAEHQPIESRIELMDAIDRLQDTYKTVIILRYYRDFTTKQIAQVLGCPEGTVKTHIHRATNHLRKHLKEDYINESPF